jgi:hypothetical protein
MAHRYKDPAIYAIRNKLNGKLYIGYAFNYRDRWNDHRTSLRRNVHKNIHLQHAWNKDGEESFKFERIEICEPEQLPAREHYWAILLNVHNPDFGYNLKPTDPNGRPGRDESSIRKQIATMTGVNRPVYQVEKNGALVKVWNGINEVMSHYSISRQIMYDLKNGKGRQKSKAIGLFKYRWLSKKEYLLTIKTIQSET